MSRKNVNLPFIVKISVVMIWSFAALWLSSLIYLRILVWLVVMPEPIASASLILVGNSGIWIIIYLLFGSMSLLLWRRLPVTLAVMISVIVPILLFFASISYGRIDTYGTTGFVTGDLQNTREQLLIHMARYGLSDELKALIKVGTKTNVYDPMGHSALYWTHEPEIARILIQAGAKGDTKALVNAAQWGRLDVVKGMFKASNDDGKVLVSGITDQDLEFIKTVHNGGDNNREEIVKMLLVRRSK